MAKIKKYELNGKTEILLKLGFNEEIDYDEVKLFRQKIIKGMFLPEIIGKKLISYKAPFGKSFYEYLGEGIHKSSFFFFIIQIIEIVKRARTFGLDENKILFSLDKICINETNRQLFVTYVPLRSEVKNRIDLLEIVADIVRNSVFDLKEDTAFLDDFIEFINNRKIFSIEEMESYITNVCPEAYNMFKTDLKNIEPVREENSQAGVFERAETKPTPIVPTIETKSDIYIPTEHKNEEDDEDVTIPKPEVYDDIRAESCVLEHMEEKQESTKVETAENDLINKLSENDDITIPKKEFFDVFDKTIPNRCETLDDEEEFTVAIESYETQEDGLDLTEALEALDETDEFKKVSAYLIRVKTCEEISVVSDEFKIGKSLEKADYAIANNSAISRVHAIIQRNGEHFYLIDNQSTNGTFVDGERIAPNEIRELFDGNQIQLANEVFEFFIRE